MTQADPSLAKNLQPFDLASLFQKPLIVGASVSAGFGAIGPGTRAALEYTTRANVISIARGGAHATEMSSRLTHRLVGDRSIIIAIDYLFWDSTLPDADDSLRALHHLLKLSREHEIPVVLGDVPELLPGVQPSRNAINKAIHESSHAHEYCRIVRLDELHQQVLRKGYLDFQGQRYRIWELVPDGLHLADLASRFLAERILDVVT